MKRTAAKRFTTLAVLSVLAVLPGPWMAADDAAAPEGLPAGAKIAGLEVFPASIELKHRFDYRQLLITARLEGGTTMDATRWLQSGSIQAEEPAGLIKISPSGQARPVKDGAGELKICAGQTCVKIPVQVSGATAEFKASFYQDVMPILSKAGCTAGTCHGSASGKNGFKLSIRGNDPVFDHRALTDDLKGRRFNRASPDKSLFLMKISGPVPHMGGIRAAHDSPYYGILRSWVAGGVKLDSDAPRVQNIEIFPKNIVLQLPGMKQQMAVLATYTDGKVRDVSADAFIETSNTDATRVDETGLVTALRRGETAIMARFEGSYTASQFFVMGDRSGYAWQETPEFNFIDTLVYAKLKKVKSLPSELCTDEEFLRRLHLDLTGLPPTPKETRIFLADRRDSRIKREELIDRLIGSPDFVEHWTNKWSDLLQVNSKFLGSAGVDAFRDWIRQTVASDMPYDQFVHTLLTEKGSTLQHPAASYFKVLREPDLVMENTTQLFLGIRFNCNKCHDHPFERWTQNNHWQMASFFAQIGRENSPGSPLMPQRGDNQPEAAPVAFEEVISDKDTGDAKYPNGLIAAPLFPYKHAGKLEEKTSRRERLAQWLATSDNPYFAMSFVNRLWSYLLGVGIIEPVDDIRAGNPPSNPELLKRLTEEFVKGGFNIRGLMRSICRSRVYQHSIRAGKWNEDDEINFSHALARRLPAETLYDAVHLVTGAVTKLPGMRLGTRAAETPDSNVRVADDFLDLFGRPPRESACECERSSGMSLRQALNLVNGPTVAEAVRDPSNKIADLLRIEKNPSRVVEELYISILCRKPSEKEQAETLRAFNVSDPVNGESMSAENTTELGNRLKAWESSQSAVAWTEIEPSILKSAAGAAFTRLADGSLLADGTNADKDTYTLAAWTNLAGITGLRIEALPDAKLKGNGPGRGDDGNFVLSELRLTVVPANDPSKARAIPLQNAQASFSQNGFPVANAIDGKLDTGWAINPGMGRRQVATFETQEDFGSPEGSILTLTLEHQYPGHFNLGRFRIMITGSKRPIRPQDMPEDVLAALLTPAEKRTPEHKAAIFAHYISQDPDMAGRIRMSAAQDLAWALLNSPAFLFNR